MSAVIDTSMGSDMDIDIAMDTDAASLDAHPPQGPGLESGFPIASDDVLSSVDEEVRAADSRVRAFVVKRPLVALGAALAGGYLVGRLLAR